LYESNRLTNDALVSLAGRHHIHRIRVVRPDGSWAFSSHPRVAGHDTLSPPRPDFSPIFSGAVDTLFISLRPARADVGYRHGVALAAADRSAIVLNLDAELLLQFRREIGLGPMLQKVALDPNIVYVVLQDTAQVLAAAGETAFLDDIEDDPFLQSSWLTGEEIARDRVLNTDPHRVLEIVHPFVYDGTAVGIFRVGLSLEPLDAIDTRVVRRLVIITVIILVLGFLVLAFIVVRQNVDLLSRQYRAVETYSSRVIDRVGDGIIVFNALDGVQTINPAAKELLGLADNGEDHRSIHDLLPGEACREFLDSPAVRDQVACELPHGTVHLLMGKTLFENERGVENTILILRDQTRLKQLEAQIRQRERTHEMSALASGLAHEIRNPLNAVGTIVQQLRMDFTPTRDPEGYEELTTLVYSEVRRINDAIQDFLQSVRPKPVQPEPFKIEQLLRFIEHAFAAVSADSGIRLHVEAGWKGIVGWDRDQMQHVLMNLVQNAFDACKEGDTIAIRTQSTGAGEIVIEVSDSGSGIPTQVQDRIFNLYFTTKASGTGIGLGIVQRIVIDHGGIVEMESKEGVGTTFTLRLPPHIPAALVNTEQPST
jgi:signal transduction histidine kinase